MITNLPKDVLWIIMKHYLSHVIQVMEKGRVILYEIDFCNWRIAGERRHLFEKTINEEREIGLSVSLRSTHFVDCLYPLRLVCKKFDTLMRQKIICICPRRIKVLS
jgi:hypothetical protein